jgi:hypothetical protein
MAISGLPIAGELSKQFEQRPHLIRRTGLVGLSGGAIFNEMTRPWSEIIRFYSSLNAKRGKAMQQVVSSI